MRLGEIPGIVIRSKNAKPFRLTFDIIFPDRATYQRVRDSGVISRRRIAEIYPIPESDVTSIVAFDPGCAIKVTIKRPQPAGSVGDTDLYGAQQHAPLVMLEIPD